MRTIATILLFACLAGCGEEPLAIPPAGTYLPELCAVVGVIGGGGTPEPPAPAPAPTPAPVSDKCENCNGTGKLGDGRVSIVCPVCDGTGKVTRAALMAEFVASLAKMAEQAEMLSKLNEKLDAAMKHAAELEEAAKNAPKPEDFQPVDVPQKQSSFEWLPSIKTGREEATAQNKPLHIHWFATWCGPCKNMDRMVLEKPEVQAALHEMAVSVRQDIDANEKQTDAWKIKKIPTDTFISPDYKKRIDVPMTIDPAKFIERSRRAAAEIQAYIDNGKDSINVRPVIHEVPREIVYERPVYFEAPVYMRQAPLPSYDAFPPGYRGGGGCANGSCGMGFW